MKLKEIKFRLQVARNIIRRWINPDREIVYDDSTLRFLEAVMEQVWGVDLHVPQHGHEEVQLKRYFTMFLLDNTDWSVNELSRRLMSAGIIAKGLSRRSLQYYVSTFEGQLQDDNVGDALLTRQEYLNFRNSIKSIL